ncbi:MAG TPA: RNA polymerase sigma factor [Flavobacteriales bacterium]|nr:RNA polymerase sigma factor [Flavobacteriales bacterium]
MSKKKSIQLKELDDEALVVELQRHMDPERFGVLYDRFVERVYHKCVSMAGDKEIAKDLVHDIFLKTFANLSKFDHRSKFGTWLYRITYNYCLDHLRKSQRQRTVDVDDDRLESMEDDTDRYEAELLSLRADKLSEVLAALDPADRGVLLMRYQDDLSVKEMMEVLGLGESAVKMRVMRARERALRIYEELIPEGS